MIGALFSWRVVLSWRASAGVFMCWRAYLPGVYLPACFSAGAFSLPILFSYVSAGAFLCRRVYLPARFSVCVFSCLRVFLLVCFSAGALFYDFQLVGLSAVAFFVKESHRTFSTNTIDTYAT